MDFHDFSMTLNQISTTKLKSRYKYEQFRKYCVFFERLSLKNIFIFVRFLSVFL